MTVEVWPTVPPAPPIGFAGAPIPGAREADRVDAARAAPGSPPFAAALGRLGAFALRALGKQPADLALDLTEPMTPSALTEILRVCLRDGAGAAPTLEFLQATPVGDRIAALMAVAAVV